MMRHSSTRTKAGTAGWAPRLPRQPLESPAELSQEVQPPASPAARAGARRWLCALPALPQLRTFHWLGGGSTEVAPNPTLHQYACNRSDHTRKTIACLTAPGLRSLGASAAPACAG